MRVVVLDTETTGLNRRRNGDDVCVGHRIIEIGAVEIIDGVITGRKFHKYLRPGCLVTDGAISIHGITNEFLNDKPLFNDVVGDFLSFLGNSELVIHNAPFDIAFLDQEFRLLEDSRRPDGFRFSVIDTLIIARKMFPGVRNDLNSLCQRLGVRDGRLLHGALVDATLLAKVYLKLIGS